MITNEQTLFNQAVDFHQSNQLDKALTTYQKLFALSPEHQGAISMMLVLNCQLGKTADARKLADIAMRMDADEPYFYANLGYCLGSLGRVEDAITVYEKAIKLNPDSIEAYYNAGCAYMTQTDYSKAISFFKKAHDLNPGLADINNNLGLCYQQLGDLESAAEFYSNALAAEPNSETACFNLAQTSFQLKDYKQSEKAYRQVIKQNPEFHEALFGLGLALQHQQKTDEAFVYHAKAIKFAPDNKNYIQNLSRILTSDKSVEIDESFTELVLHCLTTVNVEKTGYFKAAMRLMEKDQDFQHDLTRLLEAPAILPMDNLKDQSLSRFCNHQLLLALMKNTTMLGPVLETALCKIRSLFLRVLTHQSAEDSQLDDYLPFLNALAFQFHLNEYIVPCDTTEIKLVRQLRVEIEDNLKHLKDMTPHSILLLASYTSLDKLTQAKNLLILIRKSESPFLSEIIIKQVKNRIKEDQLKSGLHKLSPILDQNSKVMQRQYEQNPYPQWEDACFYRPMSLRERLTSQFPYLHSLLQSQLDCEEILIAGCGTGKNAIETAMMHPESHILALDLSLASLTYGKRKAMELNVGNIQFSQGDLLELKDLDWQFDLIESVGVLHHLTNPDLGLEILCRKLKPGAFMFLGLYSDIARSNYLKIQKANLKDPGQITDDEIRRIRSEIIHAPNTSSEYQFIYMRDFYSLSECRDLLFNACEQRFNLLKIKRLLEDNGLTFLGFQMDEEEHKTRYRQLFPEDKEMTSLSNWHTYELQYPELFISMYQFWVKKL